MIDYGTSDFDTNLFLALSSMFLYFSSLITSELLLSRAEGLSVDLLKFFVYYSLLLDASSVTSCIYGVYPLLRCIISYSDESFWSA